MKSIVDKIDIEKKEIDHELNYDIKHKEIENIEFLVNHKLFTL